MCGIVGAVRLHEPGNIPEEMLRSMLGLIEHRGPDEFGIFMDGWCGLGSARLSIIDLSSGGQPISNEDGTLWIVFNGEIFNYVELRPELEARGHVFTTHCDTEVVLHMYEEYGPDCLNHFNGQFAIAIWDSKNRRAFFGRDRLGVRPLFYLIQKDAVYFGSEVKCLKAVPDISFQMDPQSLAQIFTFWSVQTPRTIFEGINELPPAHWMLVEDGKVTIQRYWQMDFSPSGEERSDESWLEEFESLLVDATLIRLRADVPVGAYLSGGLDSSTTTALIRKHVPNRLETYSIAFQDANFDESPFQLKMADFLGTRHHIVKCGYEEIGNALPEVIWHTETPILRTAPIPMMLLSRLVHSEGIKVVVTGEGADEFLAGYDIFKEAKVRRFWAQNPESSQRPRLLQKLYPDITRLSRSAQDYLAAFFKRGLTDTGNPYYSHLIRWNNTRRLVRFLNQPAGWLENPLGGLAELPEGFTAWPALGQAQYLEVTTFLSPYLLCSQGDRVAMANSVEGRFPFLDYRLVEFSNRLPPQLKLNGMLEKFLLRKVAAPLLPPEIWKRIKRPYRAPIHRSFFQPQPQYVQEMLSPEAIRRAGLFQPDMVANLVKKAADGAELSEVDDMGLVGILSSQLVHERFVKSSPSLKGIPANKPYKRVILAQEHF